MFYLKILSQLHLLQIFAILLLVAVGLGSCASIRDWIPTNNWLPYEDCGSRYEIVNLQISSCSSIPCEMYRNSWVNVNVIFADGDNTSFLKHRVRWIFNAVRTDAHITPDPCHGDQKCITNDTDGKSYWASVFVNGSLPVISGTMQWVSTNDHQQEVLCFKIPVVILV